MWGPHKGWYRRLCLMEKGEATHKRTWRQSCGFLSWCQPLHDDRTRREAGSREDFLSSASSLPGISCWHSSLPKPNWKSEGKPLWFTQVTLPGTEVGILEQSIFMHYDFGLYKRSKGQILTRPRNVYLQMGV